MVNVTMEMKMVNVTMEMYTYLGDDIGTLLCGSIQVVSIDIIITFNLDIQYGRQDIT